MYPRIVRRILSQKCPVSPTSSATPTGGSRMAKMIFARSMALWMKASPAGLKAGSPSA
jgi:hypothetical protein